MPLSGEVRKTTPELVRIRRAIHAHPERGFEEVATAELIREHLSRWGIEHRPLAKTGTVALIRGARPGPVVLFRADMDALPVEEANRVPYRSKVPGVMHACGHDGHVAMLLGAAKLLRLCRDELRGAVKLMFQPAEEGPGGAAPMIEEGLLENPKVDAAFAIHLWNDLPTGKIGVREGPVFAAENQFRLKIVGKGGHGAAPHQTVDPVVVAAQVVNACQTIVSRKVDPVKTAVVTFGKIEGGTRHNIIPDSVSLEGTIRTFEPAVRKQVVREFRKVVSGIAASLGARIELEEIPGYPPTVNEARSSEVVRRAAEKALGKRAVVDPGQCMGAEDMSYVLEKVPGCYFVVGSRNDARGLVHPHHSARFDFDEAALAAGVEVWLELARRGLDGMR
jgi:amidohydrolase